jgi:hypothetical protein
MLSIRKPINTVIFGVMYCKSPVGAASDGIPCRSPSDAPCEAGHPGIFTLFGFYL